MAEEIKDIIKDFIDDYKAKNNAKNLWRHAEIGFANAEDPVFLQLKQVIGMDHKLPKELLKKGNTVIAYFIPFNEKVVLSNSNGSEASREWAVAYIETNKLIIELNRFLANHLKKENYISFEIPPTHNFDKTTLKSYWSHKHVAYIAGLGKFGLHKMLITNKGCCGRLGSLITSAKIEPTKRSESECCLYFHNKSCNACIEKCVFDILNINSFDRHKCYSVCLENGRVYSNLGLSDMCGKCACGVPCSLKNPCQ
jgi:epoxyqueuosine reductase QueG